MNESIQAEPIPDPGGDPVPKRGDGVRVEGEMAVETEASPSIGRALEMPFTSSVLRFEKER